MRETIPRMKCSADLYKRHRILPEIIQHAVWLYYRFSLGYRDIAETLARRGVLVTHESIRLWCNKFGPRYAHRLRRRHRGYGDTVFMAEVFVRIGGQRRHLWRAVDQDGEVVDVLLQERRDAAVQVYGSGPTVRSRPRRRIEPLQPGAPPDGGGPLPDAAPRVLCALGQGGDSAEGTWQGTTATAESQLGNTLAQMMIRLLQDKLSVESQPYIGIPKRCAIYGPPKTRRHAIFGGLLELRTGRR